jgi:hypothetical protein
VVNGNHWIEIQLLGALSNLNGIGARVRVVTGGLVRTLVRGRLPAGRHQTIWDGREEGGHRMSSSVFFCKFRAADFQDEGKLVLLR